MAVWAPAVTRAETFVADVDGLRGAFPEIDDAVDDFEYTLKTYYTVPHLPVDPTGHPDVYAEKIDYPPLGAEGAGAFLITYHFRRDGHANPMQGPTRHFTLISITRV